MAKFRRVCLFMLACVLLILVAPTLGHTEDGTDPPDKTLAPYFFVDGDPEVDKLPLKSTDVDVHIAGVIADVKVTQRYKNEGTRPIEARYVFPGSTRAAVYGMQMRVGERLIVAKIREKQQARAEYETAKKEGKTASLLEQHRPNVFQTSVANILPGDDITVELRYTELLVPTDGKYQFVYPTVVGPRYNGSTSSGSGVAERWVAMPFLHAGEASKSAFDLKVTLNSAIALKEVLSGTHKLDVRYEGPTRAVIGLVKSGKSDNNRDFILDYRLSGERVESGVMLYQGKDENFFLAMLEPPLTPKPEQIPPREYVFIVDISGSMHGFPLDTAKTLLNDLIGRLRPTDSFNVMLFSGSNSVMAPRSLPATSDNIQRALKVINDQQGSGSTELLPAMRRALALPRDENRARTIVVVTDGYVTVEKAAFELIRQNLGDANLFAFGIGSSVNRHLMEGMARAGKGEPFIVTNSRTAEQQAARFRKYVESPVLTHVKVKVEGLEVYDLEPESVPDVFAARPVVVFGKYRGVPQGRVTIEGVTGAGPYSQSLQLAGVQPTEDNAALRHLWARSRIQTLDDFNQLQPDAARVKEVTELGLKYSLLTQYTSFIAVDRVIRNAKPQDQQSVDQPSPMPEGVSDLAVGGEVPSTPEPQTWILLAAAMLLLVWLKHTGRLHV
jgi:Ca-activated chloride channel family protein